jgi:hypothetical protein
MSFPVACVTACKDYMLDIEIVRRDAGPPFEENLQET